MPYESAYLVEDQIGEGQLKRALNLAKEYGWRSQ